MNGSALNSNIEIQLAIITANCWKNIFTSAYIIGGRQLLSVIVFLANSYATEAQLSSIIESLI